MSTVVTPTDPHTADPPTTPPTSAARPSGGSGMLAALSGAVALGAVAAAALGPLDSVAEAARAVAVALVAVAVVDGTRLRARRGDQHLLSLFAIAVSGLFAAIHLIEGSAGPRRGWNEPADIAATALVAAIITLGFLSLVAQPDGRLGAGRRFAAVCGTVVAAAAALASLAWPGAATALMVSCAALLAAGGFASVSTRVRRAGPAIRRRLLLVVVAAAAGVEALVVLSLLDILVRWPRRLDAAAWIVVAVAAAVSLLHPSRHIRSGLDRLASGLVAAVAITVVVGGAYVAIVVGMLGNLERHDRSVLALSLAAAAGAAALILPTRRWASRLTRGLAMGEAPGSIAALRGFPSRMTRAVPMDELLQQLVELARDAFGLRSAEMWQLRDGRLEVTATVPHRSRPPVAVTPAQLPALSRSGLAGGSFVELWLPGLADGRSAADLRVTPVLHAGELLGVLALEFEPEADALRPSDETIVVELARQVGLALHNVELDNALQASLDDVRAANDELRRSRARIVAAGDAERRKLERNLHDGAQQHLVALAVNLRLVRDIVADDPDGAGEMLGMLADSVKDTIEELRALAHGIYPPLLVDSGLGEALRAAASRSPLDVEVEAAGVGRQSAEVEAAIYFCCLEAMQNAAKHAPESHVVLRIVEDDERVSFRVADDGPGFDPATAVAGHGYTNMSDRLGAIGGEVTWASAPGQGSTISGWVPAAPTGR
jgi:signal transduction histidine kinase